MIQTEVKELGADVHAVNVQVPQSEYDRVYAGQISKLQSKLKLPGFRPGKTPPAVVKKQFGARAHEDTVSELVQNHYAEALEKSGLTPAIQPELELPAIQPATGFRFTLRVVTWPKVKLKPLSGLSIEKTEVEVTDADIQAVVDRLMGSQVHYEIAGGRKAEKGDELTIDFTGFVNDEPFDGGRGENVKLALGGDQFIPGFEEGLAGAVAGGKYTLHVTFPEDYQHRMLAGRAARFEVQVKSVGMPSKASDEEELAGMMNFPNREAMREDIQSRLAHEAEQAAFEASRNAAFEALLEAHDISLPETMVRQDMRKTSQRMARSMKEQGVEARPDMFEDEILQDEIRQGSERSLKISLLLNAVREQQGIDVNDDDAETELERQAAQYPGDRQDAFKSWMHGQEENMAKLRDNLLEKKCVGCIMEQAKTKTALMSLREWQERRDDVRDESGNKKEAA